LLTGWYWLDPVASLAISAAIVWSTWGLLRNGLNLLLGAVPKRIDPDDVRCYFESLPGVANIHDLHIWAMSTTDTALTIHLVMPDGHPGDPFIRDICRELQARFSIAHPTMQIEMDGRGCNLAPDHVV
jgi:cobalt-zinc-cadmium efflux system protein